MTEFVQQLQQAMRQQSQDLNEELNELRNWQSSIQQQSEAVKRKHKNQKAEIFSGNGVPPVRYTPEATAAEARGGGGGAAAAASGDASKSGAAAATGRAGRTDAEIVAECKDRGNAYFQRNQFDDAARAYTQGLDADPTSPMCHVLYANRALCNLKQRKWADAEKDATSAIGLNRTNHKAFFRRAQARRQLGNLSEAKSDFETVQVLVPGDADSQTELQAVNTLIAERAKAENKNGPAGGAAAGASAGAGAVGGAGAAKAKKRLVIEEVDDEDEDEEQGEREPTAEEIAAAEAEQREKNERLAREMKAAEERQASKRRAEAEKEEAQAQRQRRAHARVEVMSDEDEEPEPAPAASSAASPPQRHVDPTAAAAAAPSSAPPSATSSAAGSAARSSASPASTRSAAATAPAPRVVRGVQVFTADNIPTPANFTELDAVFREIQTKPDLIEVLARKMSSDRTPAQIAQLFSGNLTNEMFSGLTAAAETIEPALAAKLLLGLAQVRRVEDIVMFADDDDKAHVRAAVARCGDALSSAEKAKVVGALM